MFSPPWFQALKRRTQPFPYIMMMPTNHGHVCPKSTWLGDKRAAWIDPGFWLPSSRSAWRTMSPCASRMYLEARRGKCYKPNVSLLLQCCIDFTRLRCVFRMDRWACFPSRPIIHCKNCLFFQIVFKHGVTRAIVSCDGTVDDGFVYFHTILFICRPLKQA